MISKRNPLCHRGLSIILMLVAVFNLVGCEKNSSSSVDPTMEVLPTSLPTATPVPPQGSFVNPYSLGDTASLQMIPEQFRKEGKGPYAIIDCTLNQMEVGEKALALAKENGIYSQYTPLLDGQEYLAVNVILEQTFAENENKEQPLYPYWNLTLRYEDGGDDIWSEDPISTYTYGYVPFKWEGWVFFRIREGSKPLLYFYPNYYIISQTDNFPEMKDFGAYFSFSEDFGVSN